MTTKTAFQKQAETPTRSPGAGRSAGRLTDPVSQGLASLHETMGNLAVQRLYKSGRLQAKLGLGRPGDRFEQEADRVADQIMRMPEPLVQAKPG
jgi:hypothetical protein